MKTQEKTPAETGQACHPLVTATRRALGADQAPDHGIYRANGEESLNVAVAKDSIQRALFLCEALIRACEVQGWKVEPTEAATRIKIEEETLEVSLREKMDRTELEPGNSAYSSWNNHTYTPSGRLTWEIHNTVWNTKLPVRWTDGKVQRLENVLPKLIAALSAHADARKADRMEREGQARRQEEEKRRREALQARIKKEKSRRKQLSEFASAWENCRQLRAFCAEVESRAQREPETFAPDDVARWLKWAREIIDQGDPFKNKALRAAIADPVLEATLNCNVDQWGNPIKEILE